MSDTQIIIVLVVGASAVIIFCCVIVAVLLRLQRVVRSQLETVDKLLRVERAGRGSDPPREPLSRDLAEPPGTAEGRT